MKTTRKLTAILLCIVTLTSLFIASATAADGVEANVEPDFVMQGSSLYGIDFSGVIRDAATINTGLLVVKSDNDYNYWYAQFDAQQPGVAVFGAPRQDGSFKYEPLRAKTLDFAFRLIPENTEENLFDDVDSFAFAMHDLLDNVTEAALTALNPTIKVTKADGEQVKEMTLDFSPAQPNMPMLLDRVDLGKMLTFYVYLNDIIPVTEVTLQPTAYDAETSVLTVSVRDGDGREGALLFDCGLMIDGYPLSVYYYRLQVPGGLLSSSRNEEIRNESCIYTGTTLQKIEGMPFRIGAEIKIPSWMVSFFDKVTGPEPTNQKIAKVRAWAPLMTVMMFPVLLLQTPAFLRDKIALFKSLKDYEFRFSSVDWLKLLRSVL